MKYALLILALAATGACGADFELKGAQLGQPETAAAVRSLGNTTLAGVPCSLTYWKGHDGHIEKIDAFFDSSSYDTVNAALIGKYGKPDRTDTAAMRNNFGAKFDRITETWTNSHGDVMQVVNFMNASRGFVQMITKGRLESEAATAATKAKRDL